MQFDFSFVLRLVPILLAIVALFSYSFMDWFRDRYFYLWPRPTSPVKLWGFLFGKLALNSTAPQFVKPFVYAPKLLAEEQSTTIEALMEVIDTPDSFLWEGKKFFSRCFPKNHFPEGLNRELKHFITYFWYITSGGKNIPIVSVSLSQRQSEDKIWLNIFNGCVTGLVRGLGFGPFYFVETVKKFVKDRCIDENGKHIPENNIFFLHIQCSSITTICSPYMCLIRIQWNSTLMFILVLFRIIHTRLSKTLNAIHGNETRYSLDSLLANESLTDAFLETLAIENEDDFYRDICMVGQIDVLRTSLHKYNPCDKGKAQKFCKKIVNFMNQTYDKNNIYK